jgi:hypothetical protein
MPSFFMRLCRVEGLSPGADFDEVPSPRID